MAALRATVSAFEVPARDPARLAVFYREVFGWEVKPLTWDGPTYFTIRTGPPVSPASKDVPGAIHGGLGEPAAVGADHPLLMVHISGSSLDDVLSSIETAGGIMHASPRPVGAFGRFASFRDPEGNLLGLWSQDARAGEG